MNSFVKGTDRSLMGQAWENMQARHWKAVPQCFQMIKVKTKQENEHAQDSAEHHAEQQEATTTLSSRDVQPCKSS